MNSLNKVQIIGNVTRDPELKTTKSGQNVTTVGVATNRSWKDANGEKHDDTEFHNVVCWGRLAEVICQYVNKGTRIFFGGRLQTRNWEDESGAKHYRTEIIAEDMIILTPKGGNGGASDATAEFAPATPAPMADDVTEEDLPF